jgi:hypothetical protein
MNQSKIILEPMEDLERRLKEELSKKNSVEYYAYLSKDNYPEVCSATKGDINLYYKHNQYIGFCFSNCEVEVLPSRYANEPSEEEVKAFDAGYEKGRNDALIKMRAAIVNAEKGE